MGRQSLYAVYGVSGFGREVMPLARKMLEGYQEPAELVFVDDYPPASVINNHPVFTYQQFLAADAAHKYVTIAIAKSMTRQKLAERCTSDKISLFSIVANNVVEMDNISLGEGSILSPFVTLTSNIKIGRCFHANIYSYVAHDCVIGDYVTFAPAVKCNGHVVIEDHAYIGTGAVLRQGAPGKPLVIGRGAVVGMGAIVTKDIPAGVTVVGNPARLLVKD